MFKKGHATPQQVETYVATANKKRLAKRGIALIDENKVCKSKVQQTVVKGTTKFDDLLSH